MLSEKINIYAIFIVSLILLIVTLVTNDIGAATAIAIIAFPIIRFLLNKLMIYRNKKK